MKQDWLGLRRLDRCLGLAKGSAFRAFKIFSPTWREGLDYRVLDAAHDADEWQALRHRGDIYASSVRGIVLSPPCARALTDFLKRQQQRE